MATEITSGKPPNIIIVDDHPVVAEGLRMLLENRNRARIVATESLPSCGYASYIEHRPDLIIIDLALSEGSGLILTRRIRARDPDAHILIFSIHDSLVMRQRAFDAGANAYLAKSTSTTEILSTIRVLLACSPDSSTQTSSRETPFRAPEEDELSHLTPREFDIFLLLAESKSVAAIADELSVSPKTIGVHQTRIMKKLNAANSAHLAHLAIRKELIVP